jgi:hypothetical protein
MDMSEHPPTNPSEVSAAAPVAGEAVLQGSTLTRHRQCISCGYDLYSLALTGVCAECGTPVARTLAVKTLSELDEKGVGRWMVGLRLWLICSILCVAIVPVMFTLGVLVGVGGELVAMMVGYGLPLGIYVCYFIACGFAASDALVPTRTRVALLGGLGVASASMVAWVVILSSGRASDWGTLAVVCVLLTVQSVCNFAHFAALGDTLERVSVRAGRDATTRMCRTFKWYTIIWHGMELLLVLVVIAMILLKEDRLVEGPVAAWFFSWIGHAAWVITGLVVLARLLAAGRRERAFGTAAQG